MALQPLKPVMDKIIKEIETKGELLEIKRPKNSIFIYRNELIHLLVSNPILYAKVLRRGKYILRERQEYQRQITKKEVYKSFKDL